MDMFMETIALARKQTVGKEIRPLDDVRSEAESNPELGANQRKLLDIAWKIYDITSEMAHLKTEVYDLSSKVDEIDVSNRKNIESDTNMIEEGRTDIDLASYHKNLADASAVEKSNASNGRCFEKMIKPMVQKTERENEPTHENYPTLIPSLEAKCAPLKKETEESSSKKFNTTKEDEGKRKVQEFLMDDLSFSIFKEIVGKVTAECVGKILGMQHVNKRTASDKLMWQPQQEERKSGMSDTKVAIEDGGLTKYNSKPFVSKSQHLDTPQFEFSHRTKAKDDDKKVRFKGTISSADPDYDDGAFFSKLNDSLYFHRSHQNDDKKVRFRQQKSNADLDLDNDAVFSKLNDSLYFHRSHLHPDSSSNPESANFSSLYIQRSSSVISSDGSDFI